MRLLTTARGRHPAPQRSCLRPIVIGGIPRRGSSARPVAGPDGTFTVSGLPFGSYYTAAAARLPADGEDAWQDPEFLSSLVLRASTVTLNEGQKQRISLQLPRR